MKKPWVEIINHHTYEVDFSTKREPKGSLNKPNASDLLIKEETRKRLVDELPGVIKGPIRVVATNNYLDDHLSTIEILVVGGGHFTGNYVVADNTHTPDFLILIAIRIEPESEKGGVQDINYVPFSEIRSICFHRQSFRY